LPTPVAKVDDLANSPVYCLSNTTAERSSLPQLRVVERKYWWKIGHHPGRRVYVQKADAAGRAREIHLSEFMLDAPEVERLDPVRAARRHLGRVRGILRVPKQATLRQEARYRHLYRLALDQVPM
jgi:hypothetical protein